MDENIERNFEESSGISDKVDAGKRVVIAAGLIVVVTDAVRLTYAEVRSSDLRQWRRDWRRPVMKVMLVLAMLRRCMLGLGMLT